MLKNIFLLCLISEMAFGLIAEPVKSFNQSVFMSSQGWSYSYSRTASRFVYFDEEIRKFAVWDLNVNNQLFSVDYGFEFASEDMSKLVLSEDTDRGYYTSVWDVESNSEAIGTFEDLWFLSPNGKFVWGDEGNFVRSTETGKIVLKGHGDFVGFSKNNQRILTNQTIEGQSYLKLIDLNTGKEVCRVAGDNQFTEMGLEAVSVIVSGNGESQILDYYHMENGCELLGKDFSTHVSSPNAALGMGFINKDEATVLINLKDKSVVGTYPGLATYYSFNIDGSRFVTVAAVAGSEDEELVRIFDTKTGNEVASYQTFLTGSETISADMHRVLYSPVPGTINLKDLDNGTTAELSGSYAYFLYNDRYVITEVEESFELWKIR
ncbi:MAG: hypothetical protein V4736_14970 [Bdellovibrionota bacterium]